MLFHSHSAILLLLFVRVRRISIRNRNPNHSPSSAIAAPLLLPKRNLHHLTRNAPVLRVLHRRRSLFYFFWFFFFFFVFNLKNGDFLLLELKDFHLLLSVFFPSLSLHVTLLSFFCFFFFLLYFRIKIQKWQMIVNNTGEWLGPARFQLGSYCCCVNNFIP
ncbi:unnamed protein product, partial [Vitis vinifera]